MRRSKFKIGMLKNGGLGIVPPAGSMGHSPLEGVRGKALWKLALCENEINIVPQVDGTKNTKVQTKRLIFFFFLIFYVFIYF